MRNFLLLLLAGFVLAALGRSCSPTETEPPGLEVSTALPDSILYAGGQYFVYITTEGRWQAEGLVEGLPAADLTLSPSEGTGNAVVVARIAPLTGAEGRTITLRVRCGDLLWEYDCYQRSQAETLKDQDLVKGRLEVPRLKVSPQNLYVRHFVDHGDKQILNYSFEYSYEWFHTRWVAFTADDFTCRNVSGRTDAWAPDPEIPAEYRTHSGDYNPKYTRGHLVASNDRRFSVAANQQTFYYSNMSPMLYDFNGGQWLELELKVKSWSELPQVRDTLYVVKGGTIDRPEQRIELYNGRTAVPKYYFMAILALKNQEYEGIAFYMQHKNYPKPYQITPYVLSIDELEELTDIDFFPLLPDEVEERVEAGYNTTRWPGL